MTSFYSEILSRLLESEFHELEKSALIISRDKRRRLHISWTWALIPKLSYSSLIRMRDEWGRLGRGANAAASHNYLNQAAHPQPANFFQLGLLQPVLGSPSGPISQCIHLSFFLQLANPKHIWKTRYWSKTPYPFLVTKVRSHETLNKNVPYKKVEVDAQWIQTVVKRSLGHLIGSVKQLLFFLEFIITSTTNLLVLPSN